MTARPALGDLDIRRATREDDPGVLALMRSSLGWGDDPRYEALFDWKHRQNPFGESPGWVARHEERVVGYRTFMRWEFRSNEGQVLTAVRAVDTATDPDYRGLGIFRALTMLGVEELTAEGVGFVFNTPNDQSRPGYLKMGWQVVGRLPVGVLPSGPGGLARMARARVPAELWSMPTEVGIDAGAALADPVLVEALLRHAPTHGLRTRRTGEYLRWRFALEPLHYRLVLVDETDPGRGGLLVRLRRRGDATEMVLAEALIRSAWDLASTGRLAARATAADYTLGIRGVAGNHLLPLPWQGPTLTHRPVGGSPPAGRWRLAMADVELM